MNEEVKPDDKKVEKMNSEHHTMFKLKVPGKEIPGKEEGFYSKEAPHTRYRLFVDDFMEFNRGLHDIYNELWNASSNDILELRINSSGGLVNEGGQFYSIIKNKFNGRCTTILDNKGYSMGALTFLMGDERIITERADLMLHTFSGVAHGKSGEIKSRVDHVEKHLQKFFKEILVDNKFITEKEFELMCIGQDYWMGTKELCERGMATHVLVNGDKITASKYLKKLNKSKKK